MNYGWGASLFYYRDESYGLIVIFSKILIFTENINRDFPSKYISQGKQLVLTRPKIARVSTKYHQLNF